MDFAKFLEATGLLSESGLDIAAAGRLAARFSKNDTVPDLLERPPHGLGEVPTRILERLSHAYQLHRERREEIRRLEKTREAAKAPSLPAEVLDAPTYAHSVRALERVAKAADATTHENRTARIEALKAGVELWDRCFAIAWRDGFVACTAPDAEHPELPEFEEQTRQRSEPANLPFHRWQAMRRGEHASVLALELDMGVHLFTGQVQALSQRLGVLLTERDAVSLIQELITSGLQDEIFRALDQEAEVGAMWSAASTYGDLLRSEPLRLDSIHAVHLPAAGAPAGLAVIDRKGVLVRGVSLPPEEGWLETLAAQLAQDGAQALVVPAEPQDADRQAQLRKRFGDKLALKPIPTTGLSEARESLDGIGGQPSEVASAMVLALRAQSPFKEWSRVDPVALDLVENQTDLDSDRLRRFLLNVRKVVKLRPDEETSPPLGALTSSFNPLVKDLSDLKAGMPVPGVITNITSFGAFVNIGLSQEGMIHISELADHFVKDPHEVVRVGQLVQAKVLAVDEARQRISLSLRKGERTPGGRGGPPHGGGSGDRSQALQDLEKLFKK